MTIDEARELLQARKGSMRCSELVEMLEFFGFSVRDGNNGNHRVVTHRGLSKFQFYSWGFNCVDPIPNNYVTQFRGLLNTYREGLMEIGYE